jgi:hypothetical protein
MNVLAHARFRKTVPRATAFPYEHGKTRRLRDMSMRGSPTTDSPYSDTIPRHHKRASVPQAHPGQWKGDARDGRSPG